MNLEFKIGQRSKARLGLNFEDKKKEEKYEFNQVIQEYQVLNVKTLNRIYIPMASHVKV